MLNKFHISMMEIAKLMSENSKCKRAKVGCIITKDNRIISSGYNGAFYNKNCNKCEPACKNSIHAESNAILYAAKNGIELSGGTLYTTYSPCIKCAQQIAMVGITNVFYEIEYRLSDGIQFLKSVGIKVNKI